ncbi:MAG: hypothetical protein EPN91_02410 [Salinibacterium sp.]|nr:MAG: hypothetical protein EPN91_02410 [Salinibacterium sp.]
MPELKFTWDDVSEGAGAAKAGILGFGKSGKTYTAVMLAIAAREALGQKGPIAFFDTETGSLYTKHIIKELTGLDPLVKKARSFPDLIAFARACEEANVGAIVVDSITHPWRELCAAYLKERNEALAAAGKKYQKKKLEFQDWDAIKTRWAAWSDWYLNTGISIVVCGRAGFDVHMEKDEETGNKELVRDSVKMKVEGEFSYEPSLLIEMEAEQEFVAGSKVPKITRRATVLGDRFNVLDGQSWSFTSTTDNAKALAEVKKFFGPHLRLLTAGSTPGVDVSLKSKFGFDESGEGSADREVRERKTILEEIKNDLMLAHPGITDVAKGAKASALRKAFDTGAWAKLEAMSVEELRVGRQKLLAILKPEKPAPTVATTEIREFAKPVEAAKPPADPDLDFNFDDVKATA